MAFDGAQEVLSTYCAACHSGDNTAGGFDLDRYPNIEALHSDPERWEAVAARVRDSEMPPRGMPAPDGDQRQALVDWIESTLNEAACAQGLTPGPNPLRRLNRAEYAATIRDLFDVHYNAGAGLPAEGAGGEGFDNAAETLFLSPVHAEKYLDAARGALQYAAADPKARDAFLIATPGDDKTPRQAAEEILRAFLPKAFRRPVHEKEVEKHLSLFDKAVKGGDEFEAATLYMLESVLLSPHFLFLVETPNESADPVRVSSYELASRLSYFLWGSMPDEELFRLAKSGLLEDRQVFEGKVLCMLGDRRTRIFSERFVEQWLGTRELGRDIEPDAEIFPEWARDDLQMAIRYEPILFFDEVISHGRSLLDLIDSDYSLLNKDLTKHYGIEAPKDLRDQPRVVRWPHDRLERRGGLLSMAAILAVSSYPNRTSPVLRGKWVLENLLGEPPPPPPPDVPELEEEHDDAAPATLRARLEQHRANPTCATCHDRIDPIGFGLENYDVLGRWRDEDAGLPIDSAGVLPDGTRFHGPKELKLIMLDRKDQLLRVLTRKMLAYALGRGLTLSDRCTVDNIVERVKARNYNAHTLILEIVSSAPFQMKPGAERPTD